MVLAGYTVVYCVPCLILLTPGIPHADKVRTRLRGVSERFSTGTAKRSIPAATALFLLGSAVLTTVMWP